MKKLMTLILVALALELLPACGSQGATPSPAGTSQEATATPVGPAYVNPDSFTEQEVIVGSGEWALPGTLTLPKGDGPFPAAVLVHGSGPNDRDETIGPNKPFRDLAWGLASQGIAVLRYDKRTKVHGAKMAGLSTLTINEETVDDAVLAADLLRQNPKIKGDSIVVIGHSLGGMAIPRIGAADPALAGLVVMAGPTRPLADMILEQVGYINGLDGSTSAAEQQQFDLLATQVAAINDPALAPDTPQQKLLNVPAAYWLDLRAYHPAEEVLALKQPLLFLQGERDYQVTLKDLEGWQSALGGRENVTFKRYPDLNHLFISGSGPSGPEEYGKAGHVADPVIADLAAWIRQR